MLEAALHRCSEKYAGVAKRCSENMQQPYKRTPMPTRDFNKVALQLY